MNLELIVKNILMSELGLGLDKKVAVGSNDLPLSSMIGMRVLTRAHRMGVNIGTIDHVDSEFFYLKDSRKLWRWQAKEGIALESVAATGIKDGTRATSVVAMIPIRHDDLCGAMTVDSNEVWEQLYNWPVSEQS